MSRFERVDTIDVESLDPTKREMVREVTHLACGEWKPGEEAWYPPDDFMNGEAARLVPPDLPPHVGDIALREPRELTTAA